MKQRSHPPTLLKLAERTLVEECGVAPGDSILAAVSGGGDSMAMLHVLSQLSERLDFKLFAHGVDHGLRPEAGTELALAADLCMQHAVPFSTSELSIGAGSNLQARARDARYESLGAAKAQVGAQWVATAHHADDRAETVLLRLLRGCGPTGLAVLPPVDGNRIRPLVRARKHDISLHLERHGIPWATDPSNSDPSYLRVRVRRELMGVLGELSPAIVAHLNNLADDLADAETGVAPLPTLGRAHTEQLSEILRLGRLGAHVRLPGGRVLRLDREPPGPHIKN